MTRLSWFFFPLSGILTAVEKIEAGQAMEGPILYRTHKASFVWDKGNAVVCILLFVPAAANYINTDFRNE